MPVDLGLLDFDASPRTTYAAVRSASLVSESIIKMRLQEIDFLKSFHADALQIIRGICGAACSVEDWRIRTALVRQMRLTGSEIAGFHLWASCGFSGFADENLKLSAAGTLVDEALHDHRGCAVWDLTNAIQNDKFYSVGRPGYLRSVIPNDLKWAAAFPLIEDATGRSGHGRVSVALTVDGNFEATERLLQMRDALKKLSLDWKVS